jgi:TIR domain
MTDAHIFISYRRRDSAHAAQRIHAFLSQRFGVDAVFMDHEIPAGQDWLDRLREELGRASAVVLVIGERFVELLGPTAADPTATPDYVRMEVETALELHKPVFSVVAGPADMVPAHKLPPSMRELTRSNAVIAPLLYFDTAMERLAHDLALRIGWVGAQKPEAQPETTLQRGLGTLALPLLGSSAALGAALLLWAIGALLAWLSGAGTGSAPPWPAVARHWTAAQYLLATLVLGVGPFLAYWIVSELRIRAALPAFNVMGALTVANMTGILLSGGLFLLLSTLPGWHLDPWLPDAVFPPQPGAAHYVALSLWLLAIALGAVLLTLAEPAARRLHDERRTRRLALIQVLGVVLLLCVAWFVVSLALSLHLPPGQDRVPVVGYLMLCPVLSLLLASWQVAQAHLGVGRQRWPFRGLLYLLGALYFMATVALFAYGPLRVLAANAHQASATVR